MDISAQQSLMGQRPDPRIDLLRGLATWFLFVDHIPYNVVNQLTLRNFGFTGATDVFVFVSGYAITLLFGKMAIERGFLVAATRIFRRTWQLYAAYVVLFVIYIDIIGNVAAQYAATDIIDEYNVSGLVDHPIRTLMYGLILQAKPLNLDTLQLLIALIAVFPALLWSTLRWPNFTLLVSIAIYAAARKFDWSLPAFPSGSWYFNPFCWQLLPALGGWFAIRGERLAAAAHRQRWLLAAAAAYVAVAFVITVGSRVPDLTALMPDLQLAPLDKENLAPYRILHLLALALLFTYFVPRDLSALRSKWLQPMIKCGEHWLATFCVGVFMSFAGHFVLITAPNSIAIQILVSAAGIGLLTALAYYLSWSQQQDQKSGRAAQNTTTAPGSAVAGRMPSNSPAE